MESLIHRLEKQKQIDCPKWLPSNLCYLTLMGSRAYGCHHNDSDYDYYGFAVPPRNYIFPHESGLLLGFDDIPKFDQYQKDNFIENDSQKSMAFVIAGIVRYAELLAGGNPNWIETLFTSRECVVYSTPVGEKFRENRKLFLSKQSFYKTRSYAFSQLQKLQRVPIGKRLENYTQFGFDTKFAAHLVRLIDNCEQILLGDIDLQRNKEIVKAVRKGEWSLEQVKKYSDQKAISLDKALSESKIPEKPDIDKIRALLIDSLEYHYGSLAKVFVQPNKEKQVLQNIKKLLEEANVL